MFGAYDLEDLFQTGALSGSPSEIFIHPDWNPFNLKYDADIAALILDDEVPYTKYIRPICLSTTELVSNEGYVTGWGRSEDTTKEHETIPKQIKIPIHSNENCFLESTEFTKISSKRTICGGARDGTGPCSGDSGSGLVVKSGNVFYLKGIVSASLTNQGQCDVTNFALYTNVDKFTSWIRNPTEELIVTSAPTTSKKPTTQTQVQLTKTKPVSQKPIYQQSSKIVYQNYSTLNPSSNSNCGVMSSTRSLIQGGNLANRDQFPWTVAVLSKQIAGNFEYISTGSLISDKHIITTGLSVAYLDQASQKYFARNPSDFNMYFGIQDLDRPTDVTSSLLKGAYQVLLHPSITHGYPRIANVGILVIKYPRAFGKYISPVCIPESDIDFKSTDVRAFAVGWGQDDTGNDSKIKKYAAVKIRTQPVCESYWSEYLTRGGSSKFFCAGGDGFNSACYRDQPLYVKKDSKWILRGLISIAMNLQDNTCDLNIPVLYEDVGQYRGWIKTIIN
jgi:secreted trypsin-like serine protease